VPQPAPNLPKILKQSSEEGVTETPVDSRKTILIGRGSHCDVMIRDAKASREHCRLTAGEAGFMLEDLGSKNGTYVDGQKIEGPTKLLPSQTFKIGDTIFYLV
jgi:pSer/pThr/pTyr-binding forkhead associated (FHA) protein